MPTPPYGFCQCGCGERTNLASQTSTRFGWVKDEPLKYILGHQARVQFKTAREEYKVDEETGCWVWQRSVRDTGYGGLTRNGKVQKAHRFYWEKYRGPLTPEQHLHHLCDNRLCVNPDHLELTDRDSHTHLHYRMRGSLATTAKLDWVKVTEIRAHPEIKLKTFAERYGVSISVVSAVRREKRWKEENRP